MKQLVGRLQRMTGAEIAWRARSVARRVADRLESRVHPPHWRRDDIRTVLAATTIDDHLSKMIAAGRWNDVHGELANRIYGRATRFALDPRTAPTLRDEVMRRFPSAVAHAAHSADAILAGRHNLLGYRAVQVLDDRGLIDWHRDPVHGTSAPLRFWADVPYLDPAIGDHKIIWELNRHQQWLQLGRALWLTGDHRYSLRMIDEL